MFASLNGLRAIGAHGGVDCVMRHPSTFGRRRQFLKTSAAIRRGRGFHSELTGLARSRFRSPRESPLRLSLTSDRETLLANQAAPDHSDAVDRGQRLGHDPPSGTAEAEDVTAQRVRRAARRKARSTGALIPWPAIPSHSGERRASTRPKPWPLAPPGSTPAPRRFDFAATAAQPQAPPPVIAVAAARARWRCGP
jgi:hypothetical protein